MKLRKRLADRRTMLDARTADPYAIEKGHQRRRPPSQLLQHHTVAIAHGSRAAQAVSRKMLHETEEKRQFIRVHPLLIESEDERPLLRAHEVVRVLNALGNALARKQCAERIAFDKAHEVVVGNFRVDGHGGITPARAGPPARAHRPGARAAR
jgi:hypothetical protein